jgi:hypothetical protein
MELTMLVEPAGWGWLRVTERQVSLTVRVSYVSDVLAEVVGVIRAAAEGAEAAETRLGLEPGETLLRIERHDGLRSILRLRVSQQVGATGEFSFPVETRALPQLGLDLAASVDRDSYLAAWAPEASWPTHALERLAVLGQR